MSNYGELEAISAEAWGATTVSEYDNAANWAVTQNAPDDPWNPSSFSRRVWTEPADGVFWHCTVAYGLDTLEAALAASESADESDLEGEGCGGFPWTRMSPALEVRGTWADNYGQTVTISEAAWGPNEVHQFDNDSNWAVAQNPADDEWNPSKYSRVVWTELADGEFWFCTVAYGLGTLEEALNTDQTADPEDLEGAGCDGFPWTRMQTAIELGGDWASNFGESATINSFTWALNTVISYDNSENLVILQLPEDDEWNPSKFSRVVWTEPAEGVFWACTVAYGQDSAADALAADGEADPEDLEGEGCAGFPWTRWRTALAIAGEWVTQGVDVTIDSHSWGTFAVVDYDNAAAWAVMQEPAESGGEFAKVTWVVSQDEPGIWVCELGADLESAEAAMEAENNADATDPASGGCGGAPWGWLTPKPEPEP